MLPPIPAKRYFTIGEVGELCGVKPHVLRYWEQEFSQLRPVKRRGNRRYYQHHEVLMIRRIRELLYEQGFTINGARNRLQQALQSDGLMPLSPSEVGEDDEAGGMDPSVGMEGTLPNGPTASPGRPVDVEALRRELTQIRDLLKVGGPISQL
jgi:DNA-binding transcriptional MerR regulator